MMLQRVDGNGSGDSCRHDAQTQSPFAFHALRCQFSTLFLDHFYIRRSSEQTCFNAEPTQYRSRRQTCKLCINFRIINSTATLRSALIWVSPNFRLGEYLNFVGWLLSAGSSILAKRLPVPRILSFVAELTDF